MTTTQATFPCERHHISDTPGLSFMMMARNPAYQYFPQFSTIVRKATADDIASVRAQLEEGTRFQPCDLLFFTDEYVSELEEFLNAEAFGQLSGKELFAFASLHGMDASNTQVAEVLARRAFARDFATCEAMMDASVKASELTKEYEALLGDVKQDAIRQTNEIIFGLIKNFKMFG